MRIFTRMLGGCIALRVCTLVFFIALSYNTTQVVVLIFHKVLFQPTVTVSVRTYSTAYANTVIIHTSVLHSMACSNMEEYNTAITMKAPKWTLSPTCKHNYSASMHVCKMHCIVYVHVCTSRLYSVANIKAYDIITFEGSCLGRRRW